MRRVSPFFLVLQVAGFVLMDGPASTQEAPKPLEAPVMTITFPCDGMTPQANPPFARKTWPLTQPPSGPARNETTGAMSSGRPSRSNGTSLRNSSM
jgi:hypothetical protein